MKAIELSRNGKNKGKYVAFVDDEDFEYLNKYNWYAQIYKYKTCENIYAKTNITLSNGKKSTKRMHVIIMGKCKGKEIDHIDRNGLNCQKSNLRFCTHSENNKNRILPAYSTSASHEKGTCRRVSKTGKIYWTSQVLFNGKQKHLGSFNSEKEASYAYLNFKKQVQER